MSGEYIVLKSTTAGTSYRINTLKSYRIEQSMEVPADSFEFIIGNPGYRASTLISAGDKLEFWINDKLALEGYIDDLDFEYTNDSNDLRITGRDNMAVLLDNDASPATYNKLGLNDYLGKILPKYNMGYYSSDNVKIDKITVSPGENEYSIIERLSKEKNLIPMYDVEQKKLYCIKPISTTTPSYLFSNTIPGAIRILDCQISISADIKNEVIVYGGDFEKNKNIKGTYVDKYLSIKKRRILNESEIETVSGANKRAMEEFYSINKNALAVTITTTTKMPIYTNKCAMVSIEKMGFEARLLVDSVTYNKSEGGTLTTIVLKLMPGVGVSYKANDIPILPKL